MREITVKIYDDLDFRTDGSRNEAAGTITVGLDGIWRELDVTDVNEKGIRDTIERLFAAGREPETPPEPRPKGSPDPAIIRRNQEIRQWCQDNGIMNSSGTGYAYQTNGSKQDYIGRPLLRRYENYLAERKERGK